MTDDKDKKDSELASQEADQFEAELEDREEGAEAEERATQQDLNQGFDTGTHDSVRRGVNWSASYRVRPTDSKPTSDTSPKDPKDKA